MTTMTVDGVRGYRRLVLANTFSKAVADRMLLAVIAGAALALMNVAMGPMFVSMADSIAEMMSSMPDSFMAIAAGADMATPAGFYTGEVYSIMAPFVVIYVALASITKAFAGEVEDMSMGLLIANPVSRTRLAVNKFLAMIVHAIVAASLIGLGTWLGVTIGGLDVATSNIVAITVHLAVLAVMFGALAMVISVVSGRRLVALLSVFMIALVAYLWSGFVPLVDSIASLANLSPWHHYIGGDPLSQGVDLGSLALLVVLTAVFVGTGIALFRRRDIPG